MTDEQIAKAIHELSDTVATFMEARHIDHQYGIAILGTVFTKLYHDLFAMEGVSKKRAAEYFNDLLDKMKIKPEDWPDYEEGDNETAEAN